MRPGLVFVLVVITAIGLHLLFDDHVRHRLADELVMRRLHFLADGWRDAQRTYAAEQDGTLRLRTPQDVRRQCADDLERVLAEGGR